MNALELSIALREFRELHRFTDEQAAAALGIGYSKFCRIKNRRGKDDPLVAEAIERRIAQHAAPPPPPALKPVKPRRQRDATFGPRLRAWRKASRLDQAEACDVLGIPRDRSLISHYERGAVLPSARRLVVFEEILARGPALSASAHAEIAFPQRLRAWRKARGLDQRQACAALGLPDDPPLISRYEHGRMLPAPERLARIEAIIAAADDAPRRRARIEASIAAADALTAALADIDRMQARLVRLESNRVRLEARLRREQRSMERLRREIILRQAETASLRVLAQ